MLDSVDRFRKFLVKAMREWSLLRNGGGADRIQFWSACVLPEGAAALRPSELQRSGAAKREVVCRDRKKHPVI